MGESDGNDGENDALNDGGWIGVATGSLLGDKVGVTEFCVAGLLTGN